MYILATNDDGVDSLGLLALKQALEKIAEVIAFAPDHNWSAAGHTKTMHKPLRVGEVELTDGTLAYTTNGAPSDCVALAILGILPQKPALVVSGINQGPNLGHDITYSGTVAAAMESAIFGIPAVAVSLDSYDRLELEDYRYAAQFTAHLSDLILKRGLEKGVLLNVNVPAVPAGQINGVEVTRLGKRVYRDILIERQDPSGRPYYWIGGERPTGMAEKGTDIGAIAENKVSITPINLDLTDYKLIERLTEWKLDS